ncbi:MAG: hypothetical protein SGILL_003987 [Bacillariaceae sp.]
MAESDNEVSTKGEDTINHGADGTNNNTRNDNTTNVIVMSEAGKPIFARYGTEEEIVRICGLIQALRTSISNTNLGEIQSLTASNDTTIVFMAVGSITLVSISEPKPNSSNLKDHGAANSTTEAFARMQLEYVYAQLIFALTDQVQRIFQYNPSLDLRSQLDSSSRNLLQGIIQQSDSSGGVVNNNNSTGSFLVSAVPTLFPLSLDLRQKASKVLQSVAGRLENNIAFALLVAGDKLVTLVQPLLRPHQLRASDLHLLLNFLGNQPHLFSSSTELWIPMCLPRFNSTGFLYAYTKCFHVQSKLALILLSSHGTTEQFQILRSTSQIIQQELQLPSSADTILTILESGRGDGSAASLTDVGWRRSSVVNANDESVSFDSTLEDDYVNISADMLEQDNNDNNNNAFLMQIRRAQHVATMENICKRYLSDDDNECLYHFLYRLDVLVKGHQGTGHLSQCISPAVPVMPNDSPDHDWRQKLWSNYEKLSLRLRLGSATVESTMDAFDMINESCAPNTGNNEGAFPGIGKDCPAIGLLESPAYTADGLSYIVDGTGIFVGMNGKDFEL